MYRTTRALVTLSVLSAVTLALPGPTRGQDRCEHRAEREARIEASTSDRLAVRAESGSLRVEGVRGLDEVRVRAVACASRADWLDDLRIEAGRSGDEVRVVARYPENDDRGWRNRYARLDLVVEVPVDPEGAEWMDVDVDDTSGGAELSGLGNVRVDDNSGELLIRDVNGWLRIRDGSGEIRVRDVSGDVEIEDGSGEIVVQDVGGSVTLEDGSGTIDVRDVEGDVVVRDDGSGDIRVVGVGGDLRVDDDGSGDVRYRDVAGRVEVPRR